MVDERDHNQRYCEPDQRSNAVQVLELSQIVQNTEYSEEALTLRIFQALEDVATDPYTRQLLPRDTINMLRSLRLWLLPDEHVRQAFLEDRISSAEEEG